MNLIEKLQNWMYPPLPPIRSGLYRQTDQEDDPLPYRLHLRVEPDQSGILIVNGQIVLHLNQSATEFAYFLVGGLEREDIIRKVSGRYRLKREQVEADYDEFIESIESLLETEDLDPVSFLGFERLDPSTNLSAPYRLDCALTYRQSQAQVFDPLLSERVKRELQTEEWLTILDKAWKAGIPHAVFTGGEPTLRPDLLDLVRHSAEIGMVTGLVTAGLRLAEKDYLHSLLQAGLDHLMLVLDPAEEQAWEAIRDVSAEDISFSVHLTVTPAIAAQTDALVQRLAELGVKNLSLSASSRECAAELERAQNTATEMLLRLVWDLPVPYSANHPAALDLQDAEGYAAIRESALYMYVEPDGDVLPAQGVLRVLGNLASDPWETIWRAASSPLAE